MINVVSGGALVDKTLIEIFLTSLKGETKIL